MKHLSSNISILVLFFITTKTNNLLENLAFNEEQGWHHESERQNTCMSSYLALNLIPDHVCLLFNGISTFSGYSMPNPSF